MNDFIKVAIDYAKQAQSDTTGKKNGKYIRCAASRFLRDLERAKDTGCNFLFSENYAVDACQFIEKLHHVEGTWETPNIVLHPAQVFFIVQLFGFRKRDNHTQRRFTSALYATARKSGKSTLSAAIMLYCYCRENENGAQLYTAATTGDQARIIFNIAKAMVNKLAGLRNAFNIDVFADSIIRRDINGRFCPKNSKASTQDGLNPSHVALDEIHAHPNPDLLNVLTSAAGARKNPLWLYTTTEGYTNEGPWADIRQFSKKLLEGVFKDTADHFLALFWAVDDTDKEFDEKCWIKANPLIDASPELLIAIRKEAIEAKHMPSKMAEFLIKRLNRPAATAGGWIDLLKWQKCDGDVDLEWLKDYPCHGALDLASTRDMCAFRLVWRVKGRIYTHGMRWTPESSVHHRTERGTVPYAGWVSSGLIKQTEGNTTDYNIIEKDILDICDKFRVNAIAYDSWNASDLINRLTSSGLNMLEFVQGPKSYHPAMQALECAYIEGTLNHGGDPVLNWCASNLVARRDQNLNMAPDKKRCADKIDDMAALLMAIGISNTIVEQDDFDDFLRNPIIV